MYLFDTCIVSEQRKLEAANPGLREFLKDVKRSKASVYLSVITVGELRTGVERMRYRKDVSQAEKLEKWLNEILTQYEEFILPVDPVVAQVWGRLRVPHHENPLDKLIAATALVFDLTVVTRNGAHFLETGVEAIDPFR